MTDPSLTARAQLARLLAETPRDPSPQQRYDLATLASRIALAEQLAALGSRLDAVTSEIRALTAASEAVARREHALRRGVIL